MLTMAAIRDHLKVDDGTEDAILDIYANAAIDAAEQYTGLRIRAGMQCDVYECPMGNGFKLKAVPSGPVTAKVHIAGRMFPYPVRVANGRAYLPAPIDCGVALLELCYKVGADCTTGPDGGRVLMASTPMVELGVLRFIAHAWTHRGDAPNNWAVDSGSLSLWQGQRSIFF